MIRPVMADRIDGPWLNAPETLAVLEALEAARPGGSRFVGGCVRNTLMGRPVDDIDIATQLEPRAVLVALEAAGIRAIPTGLEHGTITAVEKGIPFEITTLRRDVETDGRRAVVAFTEDWAEDAARRDFRLNALYAEPDGTLHDPTNGGLEDASAGRVIFIGDADERLREDYLRILRFFRFNAWYGAEIDQDGLAACERQKDGLQKIAAERIWKELAKLLRAPSPYDSVQAMETSGVLEIILPQAVSVSALERVQSRSGDPLIRLMALLPRDVSTLETVSSSLRLSNSEAGRLQTWATHLDDPDPSDEVALKAAAYRRGKAALIEALAVSPILDDLFGKARELLDRWEVPSLPIGGRDLLDRGLSGPALGDTLRKLEKAWIESDFQLSRDELLNWLPR